MMNTELKWVQASRWRREPPPPSFPGCSGVSVALQRGKQTQRRHPGLHASNLTSTSWQQPGTKWMESSFSRPTMPAVLTPPRSRPQPPLAQHSQGPQRPRPWPSSPRPRPTPPAASGFRRPGRVCSLATSRHAFKKGRDLKGRSQPMCQFLKR